MNTQDKTQILFSCINNYIYIEIVIYLKKNGLKHSSSFAFSDSMFVVDVQYPLALSIWIWPRRFGVFICVNRFTQQIILINDKADVILYFLQIRVKQLVTITDQKNICNALFMFNRHYCTEWCYNCVSMLLTARNIYNLSKTLPVY